MERNLPVSFFLPWLVLFALAVGSLFVIGEGRLPWALAKEVRRLEAEAESFLRQPHSQPAKFQLPAVENAQRRPAEVLRILEAARLLAGLHISEVRPEPAVSRGNFLEVPFSLSAQGSAESLATFLEILQEDYPFILIKRLAIRGSGPELEVRMEACDRARVEVAEDG
ncbi:MAG: hypothetical protein GX766_03305 [Firmicutes bacterium]|jgi:Tfp pilus assembly protein PilO|nr:hypothetical protein [Bacillota bacterium]HOB21603.1 GspMb/PilO family protein [Bacillota bacterium]HQD39437.1 GspMb/PilO family protein [Bacillota bacterium]